MEKKLKIVLCGLTILLIAVISFIGVYNKNGVTYKNVLPDYLLSSEFTGKRITSFKIDDGTEEKIYDKDGKEVESIPEGANEADYKKENIKINSEDSLTKENYKEAKEILIGRLKTLGVTDYTVRLNDDTGEIVVELLDNSDTDQVIQYLLCKGDFSMTDSQDDTVLLAKSDVKKASVVYGQNEQNQIEVYLKIEFTKEGSKKLAEVSKNYIKTENEEENTENEEEHNHDDDNQKKVKMTIEGSTVLTTYFAEELKNGELTISLGSGTTQEQIYDYMTRGQVYAMLINNGEMPIEYTVATSEYIQNSLGEDAIFVVIGVLAAIAICAIIYMIFKYKADGLITSYSLIAAIAILLLLIRYTKTTISLGGAAAMIVLLIADIYFMIKILNKIKKDGSYENVAQVTIRTYFEELNAIIIFLIVAVVFTFMREVKIFSIGMTLFYGAISIALANLVFMRSMLKNSHK